MRMDGFKRALLLGLAASALRLAGGCRNEQRGQQGPQYVPSQQPQQQAPGTGGAGQSGTNQQPVDVNPQPNQEGFKTVPKQETGPNAIGPDQGRGGSGGDSQPQRQGDQQ
ncbi:MAG: hypothetical protein ACXU86_12005 [Archangium sp.]